jgi:hypothetical protein
MTSFQSPVSKTVQWFTPRNLTRALGQFDLDPCTSRLAPWRHAKKNYTKKDNGLRKKWKGRVWLNPPYGRNIGKIEDWLLKLVKHNNGVALVPATPTVHWFHQYIFLRATGILFPHGRIRFYDITGSIGPSPNIGVCFVSYNYDNLDALYESEIQGKIVDL